MANPFFARLVGDLIRPAAMLTRTDDWSSRYFAAGAGAGEVACTCCDRPVAVRRYRRDRAGLDRSDRSGLAAECRACGEAVSSSVRGLALAQSEVSRFRRAHPRLTALPERELDFGGLPALVVGFRDAAGSGGVDVVLARETLRLLHVESTSRQVS